MDTSHNACGNPKKPLPEGSVLDRELNAIPYTMDALIPGFSPWFGPLQVGICGREAKKTHPSMRPGYTARALVLPTQRIFSTYQGDYDPR